MKWFFVIFFLAHTVIHYLRWVQWKCWQCRKWQNLWLSLASRRKSLLLIPEQWTTPDYIVLDSAWQFHAVSLLLRLASCSHANPISGRRREVRTDTAATCRQMSVSLQAPGIRRAASGCGAVQFQLIASIRKEILYLSLVTFTLVLAKEMIPHAWVDDLCFFSI